MDFLLIEELKTKLENMCDIINHHSKVIKQLVKKIEKLEKEAKVLEDELTSSKQPNDSHNMDFGEIFNNIINKNKRKG